MSAINTLLPIASSALTHSSPSGHGTGNNLSKTTSASKIESPGAPAAVQERSQTSSDRSFAQAYEDRFKAQIDEADTDRASSRSPHQAQGSEDRALPLNTASSGNDLPVKGESLPLSESRTLAEQPEGDVSQEALAVVEPVVRSVREAGGLLASSSRNAESIFLSVASVFDPAASAVNSPVAENGLESLPESGPNGLASGVGSAVLTGQTEGSAVTPSQSPESADKLATLTVAVPSGQEESQPELDVEPVQQVVVTSMSGRATLQSEQSVLLPPDTGTEAAEFTWQGDLTDRVKTWRGIAAQDSLGTGMAQNRQELPLSLSTNHGGQLQQFAQSIRAVANQLESQSAGMGAGERQSNNTHVMTSTESFSAWRGDNLQTLSANSATRAALSGMSFAQTMQASNFGMPLGSSFHQNTWGESVSQRVTLMAGQKISSASIALDPPELGAMTVKVSVDGDQASVSFLSAHAQVREVLEHTFPRLQDLLNQQGLQLVDAHVADDPAARQHSGEGRSAQEVQHTDTTEDDTRILGHVKTAVGLIDYYV